MAAAKNILLQNEVSENSYCYGDMNTIKIIFRNLIDNTIKFSDSHSAITVTANETNMGCSVSVQNQGKSIDEAILHALADSTRKE